MAPTRAVYRIRQLASTEQKAGLIPVASSTIWRWVKAGKFPAPFNIGNRCTVFDAAAVDDWLAQHRGDTTGTPSTSTCTPPPKKRGKVTHLHGIVVSANQGAAQ